MSENQMFSWSYEERRGEIGRRKKSWWSFLIWGVIGIIGIAILHFFLSSVLLALGGMIGGGLGNVLVLLAAILLFPVWKMVLEVDSTMAAYALLGLNSLLWACFLYAGMYVMQRERNRRRELWRERRSVEHLHEEYAEKLREGQEPCA